MHSVEKFFLDFLFKSPLLISWLFVLFATLFEMFFAATPNQPVRTKLLNAVNNVFVSLAIFVAVTALARVTSAAGIGLRQVELIEAQLQRELAACEFLPGVVDVRVKGAIGLVQLEQERMDKPAFRQKFIEQGVWLRPLENVIYIMPAFTITPEELTMLTNAVVKVVSEGNYNDRNA